MSRSLLSKRNRWQIFNWLLRCSLLIFIFYLIFPEYFQFDYLSSSQIINQPKQEQSQLEDSPNHKTERKYLYHHPKCPNDFIQTLKYPYQTIPELFRNQSKVICEGGLSKVIEYPGFVYELQNVLIDFSKRRIDQEMAYLQPGFLTVDCQFESNFIGKDELTKKLTSGQLNEFDDEWTEEGVITMMRDDCGNTWHALSDFLRVFTAGEIVNVLPQERSLLIIDHRLQISTQPDDTEICPYHGTHQALANRHIYHAIDYKNKKIKVKKSIIPADEPWNPLGLIWGMQMCDTPELLGKYVDTLMNYFGIEPIWKKEVGLFEPIHLVLSSRRRKPFSQSTLIGRKIDNEEEFVEKLKERFPQVKISVVEFFELGFKEQLQLMRTCDLLIGMHGAGLTNLIYMKQDGAVIELIPYTWRSGEYKSLSLVTGRKYFAWQNAYKENHLEPDCNELNTRKSHEEPNICRTGTSSTILNIEEVLQVVGKAIHEIEQGRGKL